MRIDAAGGRDVHLAPYAALVLLWAISTALRPLLPPDETRYLTVSWEMFQSGHWSVPTLNGLPYHHKPPLLFWLVDTAWTLLGVSRWTAGLVMLGIAATCLFLTGRVAAALFPERRDVRRRVEWILVGSVPFVIYATLVLFDLLLTCCVLAAFLAMVDLARTGRRRSVVLLGLAIGLGVLAKGPVVLLHVAWPAVLYPLWRDDAMLPVARFLRSVSASLPVALVPIAVWLVPALLETDGAFARQLLWEQSAGRISGSMEASHPRPFWFYLALLPVMLMPWILSPATRRAVPRLRVWLRLEDNRADRRRLGLLLGWTLGVVLVFSVISGKQPHYIVPVLPPIAIMLAYLLKDVPVRTIGQGSFVVLALFSLFQVGATRLLFPRYDLSAVVRVVDRTPDGAVGFVGFYQGELNFLARRTTPIQLVAAGNEIEWLNAHPDGLLIDIHGADEMPYGDVVLRQPYRRGFVSVLRSPRSSERAKKGT